MCITNFGNYYPSTAVLAAHIEQLGIASTQLDFNEEFAVDMLSLERLEEWVAADDKTAATAARLLASNRNRLFDSRGRHCFQDRDSPFAHLLTLLAQRLRIDLPVEAMLAPAFRDSPQAMTYREFFRRAEVVRRIPRSVHTVGISAPMGAQLGPTLLLAEAVHAARPEIAVIVGGPSFSLMPFDKIELLLRAYAAVFAVVRFDGEKPLAALVGERESGR